MSEIPNKNAMSPSGQENGLASRVLSYFGLQKKAAEQPDLGKYNYSTNDWFSSWGWNRNWARTDHRSEVGDLDLNSLAMAVVNYTASRIPEAKPCVVTTLKNGDEERDFTHPAAQLIRRPNKHHTWANYAGACSMSWWFSGNVYFLKVRDITGAIVELWYLPHFLVVPRWPDDGRTPNVKEWAEKNGEKVADLDTFISHYEYTVPGRQPVLYPAKDVIHLKRHVDLGNPRSGLGAFESLYEELYGDKKMALFTAAIMANMGIQVPVISPSEKDTSIDPTNAAHMKAMWMQKTTGSKAGEPVILTDPVTIEKFGFNPSELDLSNLRLIPESRVSAVTGIPAATLQFMVGLQNGTSYASSQQARQQGYEEVIIPIQQVWAEEFNWQLLPEMHKSKDAQFEFDVSKVRVLEEDKDAQYKRETSLLTAGGQTINECRQTLGKKPAGPEGDVYLLPSLASPTTPEQLIAKADGSLTPEPVDPTALAAANAADVQKMFADLEKQMKEFYANAG